MTGIRKLTAITVTTATALLTLAAFALEVQVRQTGVLLLALVSLGTFIDFLGSFTGAFIKNRSSLLFFTKARFSLLNFGIVFTPMTAAYILAQSPSASLSLFLVDYSLWLLIISLLTGALFMFAGYVPATEEGTATFKLDRQDQFTNQAFLVRRIILASSLVVTILVCIDGLQSGMALWTALFGLVFIATVPLHIKHRHVLSMTAEAVTLGILFCGAFRVFLP